MLTAAFQRTNKTFFKRAILPILILSQQSKAMSTSASTSKPAPAALIFLHGLGDTPAGWSSLENQLPQIDSNLSNLHYVFPPAGEIPLTINGGMRMPGWFDLFDWPIGVGAKNDEEGLKRSVEQIQDCVKDLEAKGLTKDRIVIGGFSQGGAVALRAVYHSSENSDSSGSGSGYAACVNLSGWLTFEETNQVSDQIPLFWGHGSFDDKVLFEQQAHGVNKLLELGVKEVKDSSYSVGHSSHPQELVDFAKFLNEVLFGSACAEK